MNWLIRIGGTNRIKQSRHLHTACSTARKSLLGVLRRWYGLGKWPYGNLRGQLVLGPWLGLTVCFLAPMSSPSRDPGPPLWLSLSNHCWSSLLSTDRLRRFPLPTGGHHEPIKVLLQMDIRNRSSQDQGQKFGCRSQIEISANQKLWLSGANLNRFYAWK